MKNGDPGVLVVRGHKLSNPLGGRPGVKQAAISRSQAISSELRAGKRLGCTSGRPGASLSTDRRAGLVIRTCGRIPTLRKWSRRFELRGTRSSARIGAMKTWIPLGRIGGVRTEEITGGRNCRSESCRVCSEFVTPRATTYLVPV